jgi:hypothetical protein
LVSGHGAAIHGRNIVVAEAFSYHVVVVAGASEDSALCLLGEGRLKLPSPLDVVRNSSVESSIMARCGVDAPQQVEPTKAAPSSPLSGERLRPLK